jgi:hypothetical protein
LGIRNADKTVIVGPHFSLSDGQGCYTVALAVQSAKGTVVLCGDVELAAEQASGRLSESSTSLRGEPSQFDARRSVIGLASGMPRLGPI